MIIAVLILAVLILITYVIYPVLVIGMASLKQDVMPAGYFTRRKVFLLMAAHNEAEVIAQTLEQLTRSSFPSDDLHCYIGSDASDDATVDLIKSYSDRLQLKLIEFEERQGKPSIINHLVAMVKGEHNLGKEDLFLLTDANVQLDPDFIRNLTSAFDHPQTGLADGVVSDPEAHGGIAGGERQYLQMETKLKLAESKLWGYAMGPFGGAYMMRPSLYQNVPDNFLVDDFFLFFNVLKNGYRSEVVENALCFETVSGSIREEYKRKERISTGNFQNTMYYLGEILQIWKGRNVLFILHKLLRWLSPLLAMIALVLLGILANGNRIAGQALLIMISLLVGLPLLNYLLNQLNLKMRWLQGISYFIIMNFALLTGFLKFIKGVRSNVWEPTKRSS